jgi:hypothetical protein
MSLIKRFRTLKMTPPGFHAQDPASNSQYINLDPNILIEFDN